MRCDKKIYLCQKGEERYNDLTGDYEVFEPVKFGRYANINDMADEKADMLLGKITEGALTIRLNSPFIDKIDYIEIDEVEYLIEQQRRLRNKQTFQVVRKQ